MQCIWIHQTVTIQKHIKIYTGRLRNSNPDPAQLLIRIQIHNHDKYNILVFFLSQRGQTLWNGCELGEGRILQELLHALRLYHVQWQALATVHKEE